MGTVVTIQVVQAGSDKAVARAFGWFHEIERRCTRFNEQSELMQLCPGVATPASAILYEAVRFALLVAEETGGAFDPTVGHRMAARGFDKEHRTGQIVSSADADDDVSYRDVLLNEDQKTISLLRPLTLDLGAVAKGLAVDMAARELEPFQNFAIDAGGDLYLGGVNEQGEPWSVGVRHPRIDGELVTSLRVSNQAVCTSGDYERGAHIIGATKNVASATVVASGAMLADALATAAFVLGPEKGLDLLNRLGVDGMIVTTDLQRYATQGLRHAA